MCRLRVAFSLSAAVLVIGTQGCINVGSRFDFRKYPTPIATPAAHPAVHQWCPDGTPSPTFNGTPLPQTLNAEPPRPMPAGRPSASAAVFDDPYRE